jgi:hypothetical protein
MQPGNTMQHHKGVLECSEPGAKMTVSTSRHLVIIVVQKRKKDTPNMGLEPMLRFGWF